VCGPVASLNPRALRARIGTVLETGRHLAASPLKEKEAMSVRRSKIAVAVAVAATALLSVAGTLAVSALVTAPPHIASLKTPHIELAGMPCATDGTPVGITWTSLASSPATGAACIQFDATMAELQPNPLTPAEAAYWRHYGVPVPPCGPTSVLWADCAAVPVAPTKVLTAAGLPNGATVRVLTASGAEQVCVHHITSGMALADGKPTRATAESWICDLPGVKSGTALLAHHHAAR
jgi:hypothetical protein